MADGDATLQRKCEELEDELRTVTAQVQIMAQIHITSLWMQPALSIERTL